MSNYLSRIPENPTKNSKCIIMLHGVGSNQDDLFGLVSHFPEDSYIFSLQGCFSLGNGRFAWYPVDFSTGKPLYKTEDVERGYHYILQCIEDITQEYNLDPEQIFLMGFSQWAIMSYYTLYKSPASLWGIIALSGRILSEINLETVDREKYSNKRIFIWHGNQDRVIWVEASDIAIEFAKKSQIELKVHIYNIPHTISQTEMTDIIRWL